MCVPFAARWRNLAEGFPDGHEQYLGEDYDTLVLVAGGSGVSYALSSAMDIVRRARAMHDGKAHKSLGITTNRLSFIWTVKKPGSFFPSAARNPTDLRSQSKSTGSPTTSRSSASLHHVVSYLSRSTSRGSERLASLAFSRASSHAIVGTQFLDPRSRWRAEWIRRKRLGRWSMERASSCAVGGQISGTSWRRRWRRHRTLSAYSFSLHGCSCAC